MRGGTLALTLVVATGITLACQAQIAPLIARAGTTVVIPVDGGLDSASPNLALPIGYGGTDMTDPQRGEMAFTLVDEDDPTRRHPLVTRATTILSPYRSSYLGTGVDKGPFQIVSIVDIPEGVPSATYEIEVSRRHESQDFLGYTFNGKLTVLGTDPGTAQFTTFNYWEWTTSEFLPAQPVVTMPRPEIRFQLDRGVSALELEITYNPAVLDVQGAYSRHGVGTQDEPIVWVQDDGSGTAIISAVSRSWHFKEVSLLFSLDDEAVPLDAASPADAEIVAAYNHDGLAFASGAVTVTAASIR